MWINNQNNRLHIILMMRRTLGIFVMALTALLVLPGCVKRPDKVLSDKKMAPVVAEYELARSYCRSDAADVSRDQMLMSVLDRHGISREEYDSTMAWYSRNPDKYYVLCEMVEKQLAVIQREYSGKGESVQMNDLWPYSRMMMFSAHSLSDGLEFSVPASEIEPGQSLELNMRFNGRAEGAALLGVEYDNGVKSFRTQQISDRRLRIRIQTDTARVVRRIFGNVSIDRQTRLPLWADSIALGSLPFDSLEYYRIHSQKIYSKPVKKVKREVQDSLPVAAD